MKKDIYIIKNTVNDKVYIGQAANTEERWKSHIYNARYENKYSIDKQVIHRAMAKYGYENFYYEILESQIENYDEREQFWIKEYNSLVPNGYNVSPGGNGPGSGIDSAVSLIKDKETLLNIIADISSSGKTFENIAKKYGVGQEVISVINNGKRYRLEEFEYPLRNTRYSEDLLKQIKYSLKYEQDLSLKKIAEKYNIDLSQLSAINQGKIYYVRSDNYPLRDKRVRDLSDDIINNIIYDIIYSENCMSDIARKYNISPTTVSGINKGNYYKRENLSYPLREEGDKRNKGRKNFIDRDMILEIHKLLTDGMSNRKIADMYGVSDTTIANINSGKIKKYIIEGVNYPIRKLKR